MLENRYLSYSTIKQLKQETLKKTLKFAVHFSSGAKSSMRKKVFLQKWRGYFGFASPRHGFFNRILWKDSYSTQESAV